jgi:hypothetical protein
VCGASKKIKQEKTQPIIDHRKTKIRPVNDQEMTISRPKQDIKKNQKKGYIHRNTDPKRTREIFAKNK